MARVLFITGSDTGVGKTVLTALLTQFLRWRGEPVLALKPLCSGGRGDAGVLRRALGGRVSLDEINPWYFRAPLAPWLAARREGRELSLVPVVAFLRSAIAADPGRTVLIEGAGGLLSPLGEGFTNRELLLETHADPLVVCANRLGALNQALLVLEALPPEVRIRARVVLMPPARPDAAGRTNAPALANWLGPGRVVTLPRVPWRRSQVPDAGVRRQLARLLAPVGRVSRACPRPVGHGG